MKNKLKATVIFVILITVISCGIQTPDLVKESPEKIVTRDSCDNPDASVYCCFNNMPASLSNSMHIAEDEKGDRISITGAFYKADGKTPFADVILYAYHTDQNGLYSKTGKETGIQKWHGRLYGWCKTDKDGKYEILSLRPAPYPSGGIPAHIHMAVKAPGREPVYINDFVFSDDKNVTEKYIKSLTLTGGTGIVNLNKKADGTWLGERNITLK